MHVFTEYQFKKIILTPLYHPTFLIPTVLKSNGKSDQLLK